MPASRYDVIVVGARCAGSPLAAMLANRGLRVCLLDKADPATDTPSTHLIQGSGVRVLERLGVANTLTARTDPITRARLAFNATRVDTGDKAAVIGGPALNLRRPVLDPILADHARTAGVEVHIGVAVTGLVRDDSGRVAGVVTDQGTIRAGLVVGADGVRSTIARLAGAREYLTTPVERGFIWGYFEGAAAPTSTLWIGKIADVGYLASPTSDQQFLAAIAVSRADWPATVRDLDTAFASGLAGWPDLADALAGARRIGGCQVMAHGHGYFRQSAGPGWVLVGDAGHFKDPTPGQGIADALRQVERLAPAIESALDGAGDRPLTDWWHWRDRDAIEMYWLARQIGASGPIPAIQELMLTRLTSTPAGVARFAGVLNHDIKPSRVFHPGALTLALVHGWRSGFHPRRQLLSEARDLVRDAARQQWLGLSTKTREQFQRKEPCHGSQMV